MVLDPRRWDNPQQYLSQDLTLLLIEVESQLQLCRQNLVDARSEFIRQQDDWRIKLWSETVAAQDRHIAVETRSQNHIVDQCEADVQQLISERELIFFLLDHR